MGKYGESEVKKKEELLGWNEQVKKIIKGHVVLKIYRLHLRPLTFFSPSPWRIR
jgi:hypothetical protein